MAPPVTFYDNEPQMLVKKFYTKRLDIKKKYN